MPERIQRRRTRGWRMPEGAIYVGRPTRWGNPFYVGRVIDRVAMTYISGPHKGETVVNELVIRDVQHAVDAYRAWIHGAPALIEEVGRPAVEEIRIALRGKDVCCWCREDAACHGDVLLELANQIAAPPTHSTL